MFTKQTEQNIILLVAIIGLTCLLIYTFVHTGGLLARYVHPVGIGYICALGIESIIAGISFRLATLRKRQTKSLMLTFVLVAALVVSAFANIDEGHRIRYGEPISWSNIGQVDPIQAIIGLSATGLISLLVFAISEIIGADVNTIAKRIEREQRKSEQQDEQPEPKGEQTTALPQTDYKQPVFAYLNKKYPNGDKPNKIPIRATANAVGCSPATASKHIARWLEEV
jgi:hypothetical protein